MDNYFHFIFDLLFPLNLLMKKISYDVVFAFKYIGVNTERLQNLFPGRIKILDNEDEFKDIKKIDIIGMNPKWVHITNESAENFKNDICNKFGIIQSCESKKVILIERVPLDTEFISKAVSKVGGSLRRSIINHYDLSLAIESIVKPEYEFLNLQMEKISFSEQIQLFDSAAVMISQHGAALANSLWMKPGSVLIELSNYKNRNHGYIICRAKEINYYLYKTDGQQAQIDIDHFLNWLVNDIALNEYFG
ncbi:MAG: glycosyltransferase 61 family protein [Thermodesulfobacteriota bacterium]